ncbi:MAG: hypothetical protein II998_10795 [Clostridia bacterium]|nr:hypothetical protein [Clostridia bacterium]
MYKKITNVFITALMLITMSISSPVFAGGASDRGSELNPYESSLGTTGVTITSSSFNGKAEGFAGKSPQDTVKKITLTQDSGTLPIGSAGINGGYPRYAYRSGFDFTSNPEATFQFNVYADGDTIAGFTFHYYDLIRWTPDGKLYGITTAASWATTEAEIGKLERGRWHTIAMTFNSETLEQKIYADGEFLATITRCNFSASNNSMRIGTYAGSSTGVVAIDDVYSYPGAYDPTIDSVTVMDDENVKFEDGTITYDEEMFVDVESFKEYLTTICSCDEIIICDKNYMPADCILPSEGYCLIVPESGVGFVTYDFQALFFLSDVTAVWDGEQIKVSALATNNHIDGKNVTMIVSLRDSDGYLSKVYSSPTKNVTSKEEFVIENIEANGGSAYVFFTEDWNSIRAVSPVIINVTENLNP